MDVTRCLSSDDSDEVLAAVVRRSFPCLGTAGSWAGARSPTRRWIKPGQRDKRHVCTVTGEPSFLAVASAVTIERYSSGVTIGREAR